MKLIGVEDKSYYRRKIRQHPEWGFLLAEEGLHDGPGGIRRIFGTTPSVAA
jgi:hypothetical protein